VADYVIRTGDMIKITIDPPAIVPPIVAPVPLEGSSTTMTIGEMAVCLKGDELPVAISVPLPYTAPPFVTPGVGTLKITLMPSNLTMRAKNGKEIILKGGTFIAAFDVSTPAQMPTPKGPQPDPLVTKHGTAEFITSNVRVQAT
jgi:Contractile injection system spike tip protein